MTDPARLAGALDLCRAGRFADAERELRAMLSRSPGDADVLQLLGVVAASVGRVEESLAWFDRAKAVRPGSLALMQNRAQSLFKLGRLPEARAEAQSIASADPSNAPARDLLARIVHEEGVAHHVAGRFAEAIEAYRRAIAGGLALPQAHANLGNALRMAGRDDEAIPLLERSVAADPGSASAHDSLGAAYFATGRHAEAVEVLRRAVALGPDSSEARNNLGNALSALGRKDEAVQAFREILARHPAEAVALSNLGVVLQEEGDVEGARACYESALRTRPDFALALNNLGFLLREEGRMEEAVALFERSLQLEPRNARTAYNLALSHLFRQRFEEGWRLYEARFRTIPPTTVRREFAFAPLAAGEIGTVRRLAVWREQGVGDQILYSTTLTALEARGQDFVLEIDARLVPAVRRAHPRWTVVAPQDSPSAFAGCDRHAPMADVAAFLRPNVESFDSQPPAFLAADPQRVTAYRERLGEAGRRLVGISWRSFQPKSRVYTEGRKSAPLEAFAPLAARADLRLVDLQYGDTAAERARFPGGLARLEDLDLFNDLDGVLAAIEACDVVVTTSSVTAHLAGAAGKPTFLIYLNAVPTLYYWAPGKRGQGLWYPSVAIVTGREIDTWPRALERIDELLDR